MALVGWCLLDTVDCIRFSVGNPVGGVPWCERAIGQEPD